MTGTFLNSATGSTLQGKDDIVVGAPTEILWRVIADSRELPNWGPPVKSVEIMVAPGSSEELGAARKIHAQFGRRSGYFLEHRVEHIPGKKISYLIDEENFGLSRFLTRPGFSLELVPEEAQGVRVVFSFFHNPRGVSGRLMNPLIKMQQRRNRLRALRSLKHYAEELTRP